MRLVAVAAAVLVVGAFGIFASEGAFVAGGPLMTLTPLGVSALFVLRGSVYMVREQVPR